MKKPLRNDSRLALRKETLRTLTKLELTEVAGGDVTSTVRPTNVICTQVAGG